MPNTFQFGEAVRVTEDTSGYPFSDRRTLIFNGYWSSNRDFCTCKDESTGLYHIVPIAWLASVDAFRRIIAEAWDAFFDSGAAYAVCEECTEYPICHHVHNGHTEDCEFIIGVFNEVTNEMRAGRSNA